jgi:hypothetical protein
VVTLQLDLAPGSDRITGTVSGTGWTAEMTGYRSGAGAPPQGRYTLAIAGGTNSAVVPGGDGFGTAIVTPVGKIALAGTLADGTKISQSSAVVGPGLWPLYVSLYGGKGSVLGWLAFSNSPALSGELSWLRPQMPGANYYPGGFAFETTILGSLYSHFAGQNVLNFTDGNMVLEGGGFSPAITNGIVLGANNRITDTAEGIVHVTFTPSSGLFQGSFRDPAIPQTIHFSGAVLQDANAAFGYFLNDGESGWLYLGGQ